MDDGARADSTSTMSFVESVSPRQRDFVGLTAQRLTRAARAHVPKPTRRSACTHVSRAMQAARRRVGFDFTSRLGRRTEAGPRQLLRRVRPRIGYKPSTLSSLAVVNTPVGKLS